MTFAEAKKSGFPAANQRMRSAGRHHRNRLDYYHALRVQNTLIQRQSLTPHPVSPLAFHIL
jgi:hypothetical protein